MKKPLVSIVIPVYNGANYMREAIDSALAQTYKNIEIIVVNDGSNDDGKTRNIALSYGEKIRYFEKENGGVSTALNLALREMRGHYFSWLSHDDVYYPNKVEREVKEIENSGLEEAIVYSDWDALVMPERRVVYKGRKLSSSFKEVGVLAPLLGFISGCTLLIPKSLLMEFGGFDESYRAVQDYKLWFEMFRGRRLLYVSERLIQSREHIEQVTHTYKKMNDEEQWLYHWMAESLQKDDLRGTSLDLYNLFGILLGRFRMHDYVDAWKMSLRRLLEMEEPVCDGNKLELLREKLSNGTKNPLYIYCAGKRGRELLFALRLRGIKVTGFSDTNEKFWGAVIDGCKCVCPDEIPKDACVVVAKVGPEKLQLQLEEKGYQKVLAYDDLFESFFYIPIKKKLLVEYVKENQIEV